MKKRIVTALATLLTLSLVGCGATTSSSESTAASSTTSEEAAEETSAEETTSEWPSTSSVQIYVPFKAGGNSDLCARVFAQALTEKTGKNFVVVNQNDGGGAVCYNTVANADPDGSVLGWVTPSWFTSYFAGTHDLNPIEDFSTMAVTKALTSQYLVVPNNSQFDSLDDLVNYCKENPGQLNLGMQLGSASHYYAQSCAEKLGITWNYVEAGSDADRITAILGNNIEATTINGAAALEYVEAGKFKVLCSLYTVDPENTPEALQDIPSLKDLGYEDIDVDNCNFLFGPKMDSELCETINEVFTEVFNDEDVQQQLKDMNQEQELVGSYEKIDSEMETLYNNYHSIAEDLNILADGR
jgi:tripartite-type tricarboxylate transporter receptor subunit TctC